MITEMQRQEDYWNKTWNGRIEKNRVTVNIKKYRFILKQLTMRPYLAPVEKLEIGCGTAIHANRMARYNPYWSDRWTGIDLSEGAIKIAQLNGMNAVHGDIYEFDGNGKKYGVFLFLDSLEHFFDHGRLAKKLMELAQDEYIIIGNIPLYNSAHDDSDCERSMDMPNLLKFMVRAKCLRPPDVQIYGVDGFPYMFFETSNSNLDYGKWTG